MSLFDQMKKDMRPNNLPSIDIEDNLQCPECESYNIAINEPYTICMDCKCTIGTSIDYRPEWYGNNGEDNSRCNMPRNELLPESSMSTCISVSGKSKNSKLVYNLQKSLMWNSIPHKERSLRTKMEEISEVCHQYSIPEVIVEYAQEKYSSIINKFEQKGQPRKRANNDKGLQAAALFLSFQHNHKPKTYQEIAKFFCIEPRYVSKGLNEFQKLMRTETYVINPANDDYIDEYCNSLNMLPEHKLRVADVVDRVRKLGILENNIDTSMIAGCISYVVTEFGLPIRPVDIQERCNVSVPTINKVCEKLNLRSVDLIDLD